MAFKESLSTTNLAWKEDEKIWRASKIVAASALWDSIQPTCSENKAKATPWLSWSTPTTPASLSRPHSILPQKEKPEPPRYSPYKNHKKEKPPNYVRYHQLIRIQTPFFQKPTLVSSWVLTTSHLPLASSYRENTIVPLSPNRPRNGIGKVSNKLPHFQEKRGCLQAWKRLANEFGKHQPTPLWPINLHHKEYVNSLCTKK